MSRAHRCSSTRISLALTRLSLRLRSGMDMSTNKPTDRDEATQETPEGHTIPVPTREEVLRDLSKVAKPAEKPEKPTA